MTKRRRSLPYRQGDWVAVPLRDEGYAVGVIAQTDGAGSISCYFFGPRRTILPSVTDLRSLRPENAIYTCILGDLGILNDEWPVIGGHEEWSAESWLTPEFGYIEGIGRPAWKVTFDDNDLNKYASREQITRDECILLPDTGTCGYGLVEKSLTRLLNGLPLYDSRIELLESESNSAQAVNISIVEISAGDADGDEESTVRSHSWASEQAVMIHIPGLPATGEFTGADCIEEDLINALDNSGVGYIDGNEVDHQTGEIVLYAYGSDADRLAESIIDVLQRSVPLGIYLIKRYGEPGSREQRVDIRHGASPE